MTDTKQLKKTAFPAVIMIIVTLILLTGATVAWFTFSTTSNIQPMAGAVGTGGCELLISNDPETGYDKQIDLIVVGESDNLQPVSTADLKNFYSAVAHDINGISMNFKDVTDQIDTMLMHGTLYLKSFDGPCNVYLDRNQMGFSNNPQALAAMRLGLLVEREDGTDTYIFDLNEFGNTGAAESQQTVSSSNVVIEALSGSDAVFASDPAQSTTQYTANTDDPENVIDADTVLFTLKADEAAKVDFFLYLEGCDENCFNPVQEQDVELRLGFAGTKIN